MGKLKAVSDKLSHLLGPALVVLFFVLMGTQLALVVQQRENSANGRAVLHKLLSFSDPSSPEVKKQKEQTGLILKQLHDAEQTDIQNALYKVGALFRAQGVPQSTVDKVLSQPLPQVNFNATP